MLKTLGGNSKKDRITISSGDKSATAFEMQNGQISVVCEQCKKKSTSKGEIVGIIALISIIIVIKDLVNSLIRANVISDIWYLFLGCIYTLFSISVVIDVRKKGGEKLLKNHGAEHKVILAYTRLKRVPTVEEAKKYSRIAKKCGVTLFSALITGQIIGFLVYIIWKIMIPEAILIIIPILLHSKFPFRCLGMFAQLFTTSEPETYNLELAIAAIQELHKEEEKSEMPMFDCNTFYDDLGKAFNKHYKDFFK